MYISPTRTDHLKHVFLYWFYLLFVVSFYTFAILITVSLKDWGKYMISYLSHLISYNSIKVGLWTNHICVTELRNSKICIYIFFLSVKIECMIFLDMFSTSCIYYGENKWKNKVVIHMHSSNIFIKTGYWWLKCSLPHNLN